MIANTALLCVWQITLTQMTFAVGQNGGKTMPKLWCSTLECVHNKNSQCTARRVYFSDGRVHTIHNGYMQYWRCGNYEQSERSKVFESEIKKFFAETEKKRVEIDAVD